MVVYYVAKSGFTTSKEMEEPDVSSDCGPKVLSDDVPDAILSANFADNYGHLRVVVLGMLYESLVIVSLY